jgi:hypothetical protein
MKTSLTFPVTRWRRLPASLPAEGAIGVELQEGIPILRASPAVQERIELLVRKQREDALSEQEHEELANYEEIDEYLSFLNRITRNLYVEDGNN